MEFTEEKISEIKAFYGWREIRRDPFDGALYAVNLHEKYLAGHFVAWNNSELETLYYLDRKNARKTK